MKKIIVNFILLIVLLGGGILVGFWFGEKGKQKTSDNSLQKYEYINPILEYNRDYVIKKSSYEPFRKNLMSFIDSETKVGKISYASIFFRDLKNGPTFGINEFENFSPASLLKLPIAMTYFRLEEDRPGTMNTKIKFTKSNIVVEQHFQSSKSIQEGQVYTIEEMLRYMLIYSDNDSYAVLFDYIKNDPERLKYLLNTYNELGVSNTLNSTDATLTTHGYASIFRQLFNASYLEKESSEKILSWLMGSDFKEGIIAGVPYSTGVAHKFGEHFLSDENSKQLHDCGIVYFPDNPYLLCIMTRGKNWDNLAYFIKMVSEKIYKEIESRKL
jgi:beta-lactamase class A